MAGAKTLAWGREGHEVQQPSARDCKLDAFQLGDRFHTCTRLLWWDKNISTRDAPSFTSEMSTRHKIMLYGITQQDKRPAQGWREKYFKPKKRWARLA